MAFVKRTWLARIGTGLNKFIIGEKDANDKQTLVNSPDSVTQQGDVISADNLNDLEDRIEDGFNVIPKLTKIWENPNLSADFNSQILELDLEPNVDLVLEVSFFRNSGIRRLYCVRNQGTGSVQLSSSNFSYTSATNFNAIFFHRQVAFSRPSTNVIRIAFTDNLEFEYSCSVSPAEHNMYVRNYYQVPIAIYRLDNIISTEE